MIPGICLQTVKTVLLKCMLTECPAGFYGRDCKENCSTKCIVPGSCDSMTGQCEGGCQAGWTQSKCDARRDMPFFIEWKTYHFSMHWDPLFIYNVL